MTPNYFTGGWKRRSISLDGSRPVEPATVVWLQAGDRYADIRQPHSTGVLSGPGAFAGTTEFADDVLTWHHDLDCPPQPELEADHPAGNADAGKITWRDEVLVETGSALIDGRPVTYAEEWVRLDGSFDGPTYSMEPEQSEGLAVRCGRHVVAVIGEQAKESSQWAAVHLARSRIGWSPLARLGDQTAAVSLEQSMTQFLDDADSGDVTTKQTEWKIHASHNAHSS